MTYPDSYPEQWRSVSHEQRQHIANEPDCRYEYNGCTGRAATTVPNAQGEHAACCPNCAEIRRHQ